MGQDSSASGSIESVHSVLNTVASQLAEQLRMVLERVERLTTSSATAERTWLSEVRPRLSGMAELAKGSQIEDALARLAGLHESCVEIKRHVEQQLQSVAQVQIALAEFSRSDSVHHAEQKSHLERLAEQLSELRRLVERWSSQSEERLRIDLELQTLPALLARSFPELGDAVQALQRDLLTQTQELSAAIERVAAGGTGIRDLLQSMESGQVAHRVQLDSALGRLQAQGNQTFERLTQATRELQTQQGEQRQQLATVQRDLQQLPTVLSHISSDVRAAREDLKPLSTGLTEIKTQNGLLLPTIQQAVTHTLPDQVAQAAAQLKDLSKQVEAVITNTELISKGNQTTARDIDVWLKNYSKSLGSLEPIKELISNQSTELPRKIVDLTLETLGIKVRVTGQQKFMRGFLIVLFHVMLPAALAGAFFYILQQANDNMNVQRVSEVVEEKKLLFKSEQSCQADLTTAKLAAQKAEAALTQQREIEKLKLQTTTQPPLKPGVPGRGTQNRSTALNPGSGGTMKIDGTVRFEPAPSKAAPVSGSASKQPETSGGAR